MQLQKVRVIPHFWGAASLANAMDVVGKAPAICIEADDLRSIACRGWLEHTFHAGVLTTRFHAGADDGLPECFILLRHSSDYARIGGRLRVMYLAVRWRACFTNLIHRTTDADCGDLQNKKDKTSPTCNEVSHGACGLSCVCEQRKKPPPGPPA